MHKTFLMRRFMNKMLESNFFDGTWKNCDGEKAGQFIWAYIQRTTYTIIKSLSFALVHGG